MKCETCSYTPSSLPAHHCPACGAPWPKPKPKVKKAADNGDAGTKKKSATRKAKK